MRFARPRSLLAQLMMLLAMVLLAACQSRPDYGEEFTALETLPEAPVQTGQTIISAGDVLRVDVFGVDDLSGSFSVALDGTIRYPLLGQVPAEGLSATEFSAILASRLQESYLQDPDVSVTLEEARMQQITVDGSVQEPGVYPVRGRMTLLQAVALSGGPTQGANPRRVVIFRTVDGQRMVAGFDLVDIRNGLADNPQVLGNDIVVVDGSIARERYGEFIKTVPALAMFRFF